ncbi:MAG: ABC transporter substrate-binding protein [Lachnospiraceae bacterium]|nr:ABC transporter substrate-binding protein [Lachnospiraceae bacterium]
MKKKILATLMAAVLALGLSACGSSSTTSTASTSAATSEATSGTTTEGNVNTTDGTFTVEGVATGDEANKYSENNTPSEALQKIRDKGVLVVGSSGDSYAYIDNKTGEFSGIDAKIIMEVAKRLGIPKVEMKLIKFSELIINLNENNIDMITDGMYQREDRGKQVYFGDIWYTQGGALVVPEDSKIDGQDTFDPSSTVVGYTPGTAWQTRVEQWASDGLIKEARATGDQSSSLTALQYGKIDAFLTDSTIVEDMMARTPEAFKGLKLAENYKDTDAEVGYIAPSVSFDNIAFMKEVNNAIEAMRSEGFIDQAMKDCNLNPELHQVPEDRYKSTVNTREE